MTNEPAANQGYFFRPGAEITESEKAFDILVSLPGLSKEEIKIETKGDDLIISGERLNKRKEENGKVHLSEINYGSFTRSFYLPENVDKNKIEASYDHGMLQVRLPKGKGSMPKTIVIK
jgi:HSP20 family protein